MSVRLPKIAVLTIFTIAAGIVLSGLPASAAEQDTFAAIAYSPITRTIGISQNQTSQSEAESAAMQDCKTRSNKPDDCRNGTWTRNACVALAIGKAGGWGVDWDKDTELAATAAVKKCSQYDKNCKVTRNICSAKDQP